MKTPFGPLSDSVKNYAKVEQNGNISSDSGFWKYDTQTQSYGQRMAYPGTSNINRHKGFNSATLTQQEANPQPEQPPVKKTWTLFNSLGGLTVSSKNAEFVETSVTCKPGQSLTGVTAQGWLASDKEIWINGKWHSLKELHGNAGTAWAILRRFWNGVIDVSRFPAAEGLDGISVIRGLDLELCAKVARF